MKRVRQKPEKRKRISMTLVHPPREGVPRAQYAAESREGLLLDAHTFEEWGKPDRITVTVDMYQRKQPLPARRSVPVTPGA